MRVNKKFIPAGIFLCGIIEFLLMAAVFYNHYLCMDHAEHLRASWLVWQGKVPYRDFFEHHNPLLWFLMAPVTAAFYKQAIILYVSRGITALAYMVMFAGFYKVCRKFLAVGGKAFALAVCVYFLVPDNMFLFFELQPDAFMLASFVWGMYFFFGYLESKERRLLVWAFLLFVIAFLFLQKILVMLAVLGGYTLWLVYSEQASLKDMAYALIYPALLLLFFWMYLLYTYSLDLYVLLNYDLNLWVQKFSGEGRVLSDLRVTAFLPLTALAVLRRFLADGNRYRHIFCVLLFWGYLLKYVTGAPYNQYFIFDNFASAVIISAYIISNSGLWRGAVLWSCLFLGGIWLWLIFPLNRTYRYYAGVQRYIMENTNKEDVVFNSFYFFFNIYEENPAYYWFGYGNIAEVSAFLYDFEKRFDLNEALYTYKPKFVYLQNFPNMFLQMNGGNKIAFADNLRQVRKSLPEDIRPEKDAFVEEWSRFDFQTIDVNFIRKFYEKTMYAGLYVKKDAE